MNVEALIAQAKRISDETSTSEVAALAEAREFLRTYAGEGSAFYKEVSKLTLNYGYANRAEMQVVRHTLAGFVNFVQNGLMRGLSLRREAEIEIVSDMLSQASELVQRSDIHPAVPIIIVGALLEEYLRNWFQEKGLALPARKDPGLVAFAEELKKAGLIDGQDVKDIVAWGGLRNSAAHGEWDKAGDRDRARLMLEGVNLFMRKYAT